MKNALLLCSSVLILISCGQGAIVLPEHTVEMTTLHEKGQRVQINVTVDFLPKSDCENLINHYKERAKPSGQVSIHGPSPKMRKIFPNDPAANKPKVWAYDNLDGTGVHYNDYNYGLVEE